MDEEICLFEEITYTSCQQYFDASFITPKSKLIHSIHLFCFVRYVLLIESSWVYEGKGKMFAFSYHLCTIKT